jgi:hypothetical protein
MLRCAAQRHGLDSFRHEDTTVIAFFALLVEALFPLREVSVESERAVATH